jgi:hypothetical protein
MDTDRSKSPKKKALRARRIAEEELWQLFAGIKGSLSKELIAQRRRESKREVLRV